MIPSSCCLVRTKGRVDRKSTRLNSSHSQISYAVFCLKKKKISDDKYAGATVETAEKEALPWVEQLKRAGVHGIFAVNESATPGLLNALRTSEMVGEKA